MMEVHSIQEYISLLEKLENYIHSELPITYQLVGFRTLHISRILYIEDMGIIDIRFFREFFGQRMDRKE